MASSSSSVAKYTVTQEQFNMFHKIDRMLFIRLVYNLGRNPGESMQVVALWIWLEQAGECRDLVKDMLTWPATLISSLADEAVLCLTCIATDEFPFSLENINVPLTQSMTKSRVSLKFFRDNRPSILHGVTRNIEVCARAFADILQHVMGNNAVCGGSSTSESIIRREEMMKQQQLGHYGSVIGPLVPVTHQNFSVEELGHGLMMRSQYVQGFESNDVAVRRQVLSDEISEMLSHTRISSEQEKEVPADERTIFLTFSKGYPISENEIKDFFTRSFGECIEAVYLQEVPLMEQPLYARLVLHSVSTMEVILDGKGKAKFSIDGKHVWARKFVRKFHRSPPRSSSPSQLP